MSNPVRSPKVTEDQSPDVKQRRASQPETSVWVNASAGSGKTTVLTKRVLRLLLKGVKPERILCLTYTRAAAAEMAIRVTERLAEWATCDDNALGQGIAALQDKPADPRQMMEARRLFARVLACPGGMRIRTIHAFCQEILRRFPIEAGLPPHFAVIEENDARALQENVQTDMLRAAGNEPDSVFAHALKALINDLGEWGFGESMSAILGERGRLLTAINREGSLEKLVGRMRAQLSLAPDETAAGLRLSAVQDTAFDVAQMRQAATWIAEASTRYAPRGRNMLAWLALAPAERALHFDDYYSCFFTQKNEPFDKIANNEILKKYPALTPAIEQEITRLRLICERIEAAEIAESTASILVCGYELIRRYEARKRAQAAMEYEDLIVKTDELLRRPGIAPWILYKLDGGIDHILVDEAQDTSRAQWNIVAALADEFFAGSGARNDAERTLFVVGDEKQSIFSFQRADPEAFTAMRSYFAARIRDADKLYDEVPMQVSFRSAPAVLQAVDAVFENAEVRSGVSDEAVQHFAARPRAGDLEKIGRVEVWKLQPEKKNEDADQSWSPAHYEEERDPQAELAARIAGKIHDWLKNNTVLPGAKEPVKAGDIMILLRRRGRFADLMVRALKERNVPVTGVDRMCLVKQLPVMDLLALIQFVLLPEDDLNLATVLRGPLLNISEDQLMELALGRGTATLWKSLTDKAGTSEAFAAAHAYLLQWLNAADFQPPLAMLTKILNEPCPGSAISGRRAIWSRLGLDALDPVEELLNAAQDFSHRHAPSLQNFLHWLMATEAEIKRELDRRDKSRDGGQVRIMTVHASKGLEAPIVFLPDTANTPRSQDIAKFLWSGDDVPFYVARRPVRGPALQLWQQARRKQMEEYRRLMYVALTRAASQLYIGGWEARQSGDEGNWYNLVCNGLKSLDQPSARAGDDEVEIALADPVLKASISSAAQKKVTPKTALPGWVRRPAPQEPEALQRIAPSRLALLPATATPDAIFRRGRIIHRLLQSLPDIDDARRDKAASAFLADTQHGLTADQQNEVKKEVLDILRHPDFAPLFAAGSRAEVPMVGRIGGQEIAGQVDRLCVLEKEVWIVDYKTNRPPPDTAAAIPEAYRLQLANYRSVLKEIYPDKTVRCFLLWTYKPVLMPVPEGFLAP